MWKINITATDDSQTWKLLATKNENFKKLALDPEKTNLCDYYKTNDFDTLKNWHDNFSFKKVIRLR